MHACRSTLEDPTGLKPRTALLAVEVADSSLRWDLGRKALIYAHFAIPELWVVDAVRRTVHIHREPGLEGYSALTVLGEEDAVVSTAIPGFSVVLSALDEV